MYIGFAINLGIVLSSLLYFSCNKAESNEDSKVKNLIKTSWYCTARDGDNKVIEQEWVQAVFSQLAAEEKFRKKHPNAARLYCI